MVDYALLLAAPRRKTWHFQHDRPFFFETCLANKTGGGKLQQNVIRCPKCSSQRSYEDGIRYTCSRNPALLIIESVLLCASFSETIAILFSPKFIVGV